MKLIFTRTACFLWALLLILLSPNIGLSQTINTITRCAIQNEALNLVISGSGFKSSSRVRVEVYTSATATGATNTIAIYNQGNSNLVSNTTSNDHKDVSGTTITLTVPSTAIPLSQIRNLFVRVANTNGNSNNFDSPSNALPITVIGLPTAQSPQTGCGSVILTAFGAPEGASYNWYTTASDRTAVASGANYTTTTSGTYYVSMTAPGGCESARTEVTATVNPIPNTPTIPATSSNARCGSGAVTLNIIGAPSGGYYRWYNSDGTLISGENGALYTTPSLITTTTFHATIVNSEGCESPKTTVVATINPIPTLSSSSTPAAVCNGSTFSYTPTSAVPGTTFSWARAAVGGNAASSGSGSISETLVNTSPNPITVTYVYTLSANGCSNTQNVTVTVNPTPSGTVTVQGNRTFCLVSASTTLNAATAEGYNYEWFRNNSAIPNSNISTYAPTLSGQYTVVVTTKEGCSVTSTPVTITVQEELTSGGTIKLISPSIEKNKPVTFRVNSNIQDKRHAKSIMWYRVSGEEEVALGSGTTTDDGTVVYNEITFIAPDYDFTLRCDIIPNNGLCYRPATISVYSESITPLPVEIIYFTAAKQGNNVLLEWATASEESNTGFEVQVSQDGFNFRTLDFVPTKNGNTVIKQLYTFKDTENGKYGTRYYRLKQIDMDGQFEYFTAKAVSFGEVSNYSLKAFPNPFESEVSLELNADQAGKLHVQVLDAMGRSVMTQQFEVSKGRSLEKITLWQSLPKGIYFVRTEMNGQANNFKLLKK